MEKLTVLDKFDDMKRKMVEGLKDHLMWCAENGKPLPEAEDICPEIADTVTPIRGAEVVGTWFAHEAEILDKVDNTCLPTTQGIIGAIRWVLFQCIEQYGISWYTTDGWAYWNELLQ